MFSQGSSGRNAALYLGPDALMWRFMKYLSRDVGVLDCFPAQTAVRYLRHYLLLPDHRNVWAASVNRVFRRTWSFRASAASSQPQSRFAWRDLAENSLQLWLKKQLRWQKPKLLMTQICHRCDVCVSRVKMRQNKSLLCWFLVRIIHFYRDFIWWSF